MRKKGFPIWKVASVLIVSMVGIFVGLQFGPGIGERLASGFDTLPPWVKPLVLGIPIVLGLALMSAWAVDRWGKQLWLQTRPKLGATLVVAVGSIESALGELSDAPWDMPREAASLARRSMAILACPPHTREGKRKPFAILNGSYARVVTVAAAIGSFRAACRQRLAEQSRVQTALRDLCRDLSIGARVTIVGKGVGNTGLSFLRSYPWFFTNEVVHAPIHFLFLAIRGVQPSSDGDESDVTTTDVPEPPENPYVPQFVETDSNPSFIRSRAPAVVRNSPSEAQQDDPEPDEMARTRTIARLLRYSALGLFMILADTGSDSEEDRLRCDIESIDPLAWMIALISAKCTGEELFKLKDPSVFGPCLAATLSRQISVQDEFDLILVSSRIEKEPIPTIINGVSLSPYPPEGAKRRMAFLGLGSGDLAAQLQAQLTSVYRPYNAMPLFLHELDVPWLKAFLVIELSQEEIETALPGIAATKEWDEAKQILEGYYEHRRQTS